MTEKSDEELDHYRVTSLTPAWVQENKRSTNIKNLLRARRSLIIAIKKGGGKSPKML